MKHALFADDALRPGELRGVTVDGRDLVVMRLFDGTYRALRDRCLHMGGRFSQGGRLERLRVSDHSHEYRFTDQCILRCPWHAFEVDVETGAFVVKSGARRNRTFPVEVVDGYVCVEV